jgi:hypothetical protein
MLALTTTGASFCADGWPGVDAAGWVAGAAGSDGWVWLAGTAGRVCG